MTLPSWLTQAAGTYAGPSDLYFEPGKLEERCQATATLALTARGQAVLYRYEWSRNGEPAEGVALITGDEQRSKIAWTDSWHLAREVMRLEGPRDGDVLRATGSYAAPPGPDWGWRIELHPGDEGCDLILRMYNIIMPGGEESLAVDARMRRQDG